MEKQKKLKAGKALSEKKSLKQLCCEKCRHIIEYQDLGNEMCKAAGISGKNADKPYFGISIIRHSLSRLPWLFFLMFAALGAGLLVTHYEAAFLKLPILVAFIPMLMGIAGAGGSQSSTVIIRSLVTGELTTRQYFKAFIKEFWISIICGALVGALGFLYIIITQSFDWKLGFVLGLGLLATIIFAKLLGMILPVAAKKIKIDPALISSPLVTIIADIFGIFAYFTFAQVILGI